MSTFQVRSEAGKENKMKVYNNVENPAAVFDKDTGSLYKIGEREDMAAYYTTVCDAYTANGFTEMAQSVVYMELPKDQDEIDKVFQISGYIKRLYESVVH